jgi:hypothetical protein
MNTISATYALKYQIDFAPHYQFDTNKQCWNVKTGRKIKKVMVSRAIGYCIAGRFYSLTYLRKHLTKITNEKLPF